MARVNEEVPLSHDGLGMAPSLRVHKYGGPEAEEGGEEPDRKLCYIQGSLHADELPGILVNHHLIKLLDAAAAQGRVLQRIHVVPYANPFGLYQTVLGDNQGRFNIQTGTNFNRGFQDTTAALLAADREPPLASLLQSAGAGAGADAVTSAAAHNAAVVRREVRRELQLAAESPTCSTEQFHKLQLLQRASQADLVLDLHCDSAAQLHLYTHQDLWDYNGSGNSSSMRLLAAELQASPVLTSSGVGSECCFDDVCSNVFYQVHSSAIGAAAGCPVAMACESCTVELRGSTDVTDELAHKDAAAIFRCLQRKGYVSPPADAAEAVSLVPAPAVPALLREATPLAAVDFVKATAGGVATWKVQVGDWVTVGQLLGEISVVQVCAPSLFSSLFFSSLLFSLLFPTCFLFLKSNMPCCRREVCPQC